MTYLLIGVLLTHLTIMCVSVYLHRCLAHRALSVNPVMAHAMRLYLWLGTGIVSTTWVGIHRKHHRYTDVEGDPHSPHIHGFFKVLFGGTFLYLDAGRDAITMQAYARGCPRDWMERNVYQRFPYLGLPFGLGLLLLAFGWWGALIFLVNFLWIPFWGAGVVNGVGHVFGYRNFNTVDESRNIMPIGIIMAGEELHNNHHADPAAAKLSKKWFEFDIGWAWIKLFSILGLAHVHRS